MIDETRRGLAGKLVVLDETIVPKDGDILLVYCGVIGDAYGWRQHQCDLTATDCHKKKLKSSFLEVSFGHTYGRFLSELYHHPLKVRCPLGMCTFG
jgi:hypothetical protein